MTITLTDADLDDPKVRARIRALLDAEGTGRQDAPATVAARAREPVRRPVRGPTKVLPPSDDELVEATPMLAANVARAASAKGIMKP